MEKILLKRGENDVTVIPNVFFDNYMIKANGEYVKVYLYLLRCLSGDSRELTIGYLADVLEHTESDIGRAIKYWAGQGLLTVEYTDGDIAAIELKPMTAVPSHDIKNTANLRDRGENAVRDADIGRQLAAAAAAAPEQGTVQEVSSEQLKKLMADEDVKMLLYIVQKYLEKTLNSSDTNTILYIYSELGFSSELIEYLVEYCVTNNHKSVRYIEKVALSWHENGVSTVKEAKEFTASYTNKFYPVLKAFGLSGRNPGMVEKELIVKWTDEYGFDMDLIIDACNRTMGTIHEPSFQYADSILQRWRQKGVRSVADLSVIDDEHEKTKAAKAAKTVKKQAAPKNTFNSFSQRTYDYDAMERMLLQRK